ncbi:MAG: DUF456 domain-containing protein [Halobacterium sp.]
MDPFVAAAFAALALGVAGSVLPMLPSGLLSLAGVVTYYWQTGDPGPLVLAALVGVALVATAVDWLAGYVGARVAGVDSRTSVAAGVVGFLAMVPAGPLGLLAGVAATVFVLDVKRTGDPRVSLRRSGYATVGVLGSTAMQFVLTAAVLVAVALVHAA